VRLLGWIKSAVEFVKMPAGPRKAGPQPAAAAPGIAGPEIDSHAAPQDARPEDIQPEDIQPKVNQPETRIEVAQENRITIESKSPASIESERPIGSETDGAPDQQEIDRRRGMVRAFFNDYWSTVDDKPASFAERLDRAEGYINERVAAGGETWRLGAATRKQLGLPPSKRA
jgi:hypothetical protein